MSASMIGFVGILIMFGLLVLRIPVGFCHVFRGICGYYNT